MSAGSLAIDVAKHRSGRRSAEPDSVAVEEPLEIRLAYSTPDGRATRSVAITMRTPGNDAELATGFLLSEGIVHRADDIAAIETCGQPAPDSGHRNVVRVELAVDVGVDLGRLQRHFYTTSSCGVCGKASLDALYATGCSAFETSTPVFPEDILTQIPQSLRDAQATFEKTGGLHAAAAFNRDGELLCVMEDVGRHNAVDKVLGRLLRDAALPGNELGLMVSGRASFELMQKTLIAGIPLLAAVSAPSSLAVQLAREFNMTLVGFLRGETFNVYAGDERLCP